MAKRLAISRSQAYRLLGHEIPVVRVGFAAKRVTEQDVIEFVRRNREVET